MIPVETFSALAIIGGLGFGMRYLYHEYQIFRNDGKPRRYQVDRWDKRMMERDSRLTGNVNRQIVPLLHTMNNLKCRAVAPEFFKTNSATEISPVMWDFQD